LPTRFFGIELHQTMVLIGSQRLDINDFYRIVVTGETISLSEEVVNQVQSNHEFIAAYSKDKIIYGINTGLGPMAQYRIGDGDLNQLQYNLIRSHCTGTGDFFDELAARATVLARLNSLLQARSGVHPDTIYILEKILNKGIAPKIFRKGGVGASGDLVQLAHLALNLIGEGEMYQNGQWHNAGELLKKNSIDPLQIHLREGLALMNGTSAMTGVGILNAVNASKLIEISVILSSLINELMQSFDDHFSHELNDTKHHNGQQEIAKRMRECLSGSQLIRHRPDVLYHQKREEEVFQEKVQEYYSLRCVPQILGPIYDTWLDVQNVLENELNSVNDNPVIDHERKNVFHGGNFHGDYVSLAMDKLKIAITKLTMLSERQLNYLLNPKLNGVLPPFINTGKLGLNLGLQGMQFTATSTTAENQTLSFPMYVHSIPNNNDNQDIVSMGCNSAFITKQVIDNAFDVLAIESIAVCSAVEYLNYGDQLSGTTSLFYKSLSNMVNFTKEDVPLYNNIQKVKAHLLNFTPSK